MIEKTTEKIANCFGYSLNDVKNKDISHKVSQVRNIIYYVLHFELGYSSKKIATYFGRDDRHIKHQNSITKYQVKTFDDVRSVLTKALNTLN